ncbi:MAG: sigma-70 family RNA polymerase sigma factor, partial [Bacteroidota bacterium]
MSNNTSWSNLSEILYAFILKKTKDESLAKDLLQEALVKIYLKRSQLVNEDKLMSWAFKITRNIVFDYYRKNKNAELHHEVVSGSAETDDSLHNLLAEWIPQAIQLLPEPYREAIFLTEIKGLSQKELAEHLGISYSGAKSRVQRGKQKLKAIILECCV